MRGTQKVIAEENVLSAAIQRIEWVFMILPTKIPETTKPAHWGEQEYNTDEICKSIKPPVISSGLQLKLKIA